MMRRLLEQCIFFTSYYDMAYITKETLCFQNEEYNYVVIAFAFT